VVDWITETWEKTVCGGGGLSYTTTAEQKREHDVWPRNPLYLDLRVSDPKQREANDFKCPCLQRSGVATGGWRWNEGEYITWALRVTFLLLLMVGGFVPVSWQEEDNGLLIEQTVVLYVRSMVLYMI
jgi:hypothetical protein